MKEIRPFFTSIWCNKLILDVDAILSYADTVKEFNESQHNSNAGGWHSPTWTSLKDQPDCIIELFNAITEDMNKLYETYGITKEPELDNFWIMANGKYSYNRLHTHPGALMSGVVYIKVPSNSGNILFYRGDNLVEWMGGNYGGGNEHTFGRWEIEPEVGKSVYFTAGLAHEVDQNLTEDEDDLRIALAFNYR